MKILFILSFSFALISCSKKTKYTLPQTYNEMQIWDSIGIQYEKKYWIAKINKTIYETRDTVIFHADNSITEIFPASALLTDSIRFNAPNIFAPDSTMITLILPKISDTNNFGLFHHCLNTDSCKILKGYYFDFTNNKIYLTTN